MWVLADAGNVGLNSGERKNHGLAFICIQTGSWLFGRCRVVSPCRSRHGSQWLWNASMWCLFKATKTAWISCSCRCLSQLCCALQRLHVKRFHIQVNLSVGIWFSFVCMLVWFWDLHDWTVTLSITQLYKKEKQWRWWNQFVLPHKTTLPQIRGKVVGYKMYQNGEQLWFIGPFYDL